MGNSQSRRWQEQHIPAHLINNPEAITFLAITLQDERSTRITGPTAPVPICGIPHAELSSSWPEAARQLQVAFCRENPPIHVFFQHKRIKVAKWAIKKPRLAGHTAFVYFDERTPYDSQVLDTSMLYSVPFEVTVTIIFSPFDTVVFPTLTLQVLPASSVEALRALIGRWIEMEVKHARGTDVLVGESALALHMVQNPLGTPRRAGGGRRRAASTPAQVVSADGAEFELVTRRGGGSVARVSGGAGRFGAEGGPVLLPQRGKVGEWTGWAMCVVIFEAGISLV